MTKDRAKKPRKARTASGKDAANAPAYKGKVRFVARVEPIELSQVPVPETPSAPEPAAANLIPVRAVIPVLDAFIVPQNKVSSSLALESSQNDAFDDDFAPPPEEVTPSPAVSPNATSIVTGVPSSLSSSVAKKEKSPTSPSRHVRIPSTGNRATVMDVAQALHEHVTREPSKSDADGKPPSPVAQKGLEFALSGEDEQEITRPDVKVTVTNWGKQNSAPQPTPSKPEQIEWRRSRYSVNSAMPPLQEEPTPTPTPAVTLARNAISSVQVEVAVEPEVIPVKQGPVQKAITQDAKETAAPADTRSRIIQIGKSYD